MYEDTNITVTRYTWPQVRDVTNPYMNVRNIFPTKQLAVQDLVEHAKKLKSVYRIIIFGSATLPVCNPWSDVDAMIFGDRDEWFDSGFKQKLSDYDIVFSDRLGIDKNFDLEVLKGVTVYERTDIE